MAAGTAPPVPYAGRVERAAETGVMLEEPDHLDQLAPLTL